ncbi:Sugar kinase of the NBD/HSP70 family, may contain an N-terminal HTH domain [Rhodococcus tukisamuensis]|uniref:Sugar kinase of the NBD/HSP70 family, may contain an N-terminal HTH domain n=1 Tax=Rhodococcus tukisamuensis TaxID=168276 RepID=A0A1G6W6V1_9NOCA|nr:Sugar kinase of the NBD/HSP70 family, may contain an N-terminal HTH domain [Rhodococcus tukisamuensis]
MLTSAVPASAGRTRSPLSPSNRPSPANHFSPSSHPGPSNRPRAFGAPNRPSSRGHVQIVPPDLRVVDTPVAAVLRVACERGPIARDAAAKATGLSVATVNRQVTALLGDGLLRERADLTASGAVGRPRVPFEVNHEPYLTVGIHIGAVVTGIVAVDLRGRVLGAVEIPTPATDQAAALAQIARSARQFASRWHRRRALWVGVAIGGRVDAATGRADHPRLGWREAPVGEIVGEGLGLPVSVAAHVEAMAASELLLASQRPGAAGTAGTSLYFYARETAGVAVTIDGRVHTPSSGPGSIVHLPTGSSARCSCGALGCLEATVSDRAVITAATAAGILSGTDERPSVAAVYRAAQSGSIPAHELLVERAQVLGRTVAVLRDLFNPDRVILGGQAFTEYPAGIPHVAEAFAQASTLARKDIRITGFGNRVQEHAAAVVSLSSLYSDPLTSIRRATSR